MLLCDSATSSAAAFCQSPDIVFNLLTFCEFELFCIYRIVFKMPIEALLRTALPNAQPKQPVALAALLAWLAIAFVASCVGLIYGFVVSYADGNQGNHYTQVWICGLSLVLVLQALLVSARPAASTARRARAAAWIWFSAWMGCAGIVLLVCLGIALPRQAGWAVLWVAVSPVLTICTLLHQRASAANTAAPEGLAAVAVATADEDSAVPRTKTTTPGTQQRCLACCCSTSAWQRCCSSLASFTAWSSLFWLSALALFLCMQAGWLAADTHAYPPPGQLIQVPIQQVDGSTGACVFVGGGGGHIGHVGTAGSR